MTELGHGSVILDEFGSAWQREGDYWFMAGDAEGLTWRHMMRFVKGFKVIHDSSQQ
jgi:hypothetical protein